VLKRILKILAVISFAAFWEFWIDHQGHTHIERLFEPNKSHSPHRWHAIKPVINNATARQSNVGSLERK